MYHGAVSSSVVHPAVAGKISSPPTVVHKHRKPQKHKQKQKHNARPLVRAPADHPVSTFVRKTVCGWSRPFLAVCTGMANGALHLRGYRHRQVRTRDGTMHALVCKGTGKMPPVVVLPGLGTRSSDYGVLLWRLKSKFKRVVAIDLPGHGKSRLRVPMNSQSFARAIFDAKSALVPEPAFMLGHSLGALGTMKSYQLEPGKVLAMTLVTPPGAPTPPQLVRRYRGHFDIHSWSDARAIVDMTSPRNCWPHLLSPAGLALRLTQPPVRELLQSDVLTSHVTPEHLAQLPRHTMFVWAGQERLLPQTFGDYFRTHLPGTTRIWEPYDMTHDAIAWGRGKYVRPIVQFFQQASRELAPERAGKTAPRA